MAGIWIAFICWNCLAFVGVGLAVSETGDHRVLGWLLVAIAALVAVITMDRWVRRLQAFLGLPILSGILVLVSGHMGADPSNKFSRTTALVLLIGFVACSLLARSLASRELNVIDRAALLGFLVSVGWLFASFPSFQGLGLMICCLLIAWAHERYRRQRVHRDVVCEGR
jgi:uncharacterized membrane protein